MHRFRFGVINEQPAAPPAWRTHVREVEARGYSTFLIRDHFVPDYFGEQYAPVPALATAAALTTTLRIGTLVLDNDYRHPVMLAKEAATLDVLSDGRLELGLGAGWLQTEYVQAGMPYDPAGVRISRLEEALVVLKGLFAEAPVQFAGQHYTVAGLSTFPRPAQRPHPPILIGGGHRRMLTLAGREANSVGILTTSVASGQVRDQPENRRSAHVAQQVAWVREGAGARFPEVELSLVASLIVTDQRRTATEGWIRERGWSGLTPEAVWDMPAVLIGSVDQICNDLEHRREVFGFSYYIVSDAQCDAFAPIVARMAGR